MVSPTSPIPVIEVSELADALSLSGHANNSVTIDGDRVRVVSPELRLAATIESQAQDAWMVRSWLLDGFGENADTLALVLAAEVLWAENVAPFRESVMTRGDRDEVQAALLGLDPDPNRPWAQMVYPPPRGRVDESSLSALIVSVWQMLAEARLSWDHRGLLQRCPGLVLTYVSGRSPSIWEAEGVWHGYAMHFRYREGKARLTISGLPGSGEGDAVPYWESSLYSPHWSPGEQISPEGLEREFTGLVPGLRRSGYPYLFPVLSRVDSEKQEAGTQSHQTPANSDLSNKVVVWAADEDTARRKAAEPRCDGIELGTVPEHDDARRFPMVDPTFAVLPAHL